MKWSDLSLGERADLMNLFLANGISSLKEMRHIYDGVQDTVDRVNRSSADFVQRLKDPDRKYIQDWADPNYIATHKLGVEYDNEGNPVIYPNVQNIDGRLVDFTRPPYHSWAGFDSAIERRDTVHVNSIQEGVDFTKHYKDYYPKGQTFYSGGTLPAAQKTATLTRDQWNNLYKQGKVTLSQIPRKYQSWIEGENSSFKKGVTNAIDRFGTKYVAPVATTVLSLNPVIGTGMDIIDFATQAASGNLLGMAGTAAEAFLPDFLTRSTKKAIGTLLDNNSKRILKIANRINPRLEQWLKSPTKETSRLFQEYMGQETLDEIKKDMLNYQVMRDIEYGVPENMIPYELYDKYITRKNFVPVSRLEQWINTLGATNSVTGRSRAGAIYDPNGDIEFFKEGFREGKDHTRGIIYHELDHGAERALKEATWDINYKGRQPVNKKPVLLNTAKDLLRLPSASRRSIEEFTADMHYMRGIEGQQGGFNSWPYETQIKAQDFMAKRYGITSDEAGYLMNLIDGEYHKYGGKLNKK